MILFLCANDVTLSLVCNGHKSIIMPGAIIRGEIQAIRIGRYCFIGKDTVIRPAYR